MSPAEATRKDDKTMPTDDDDDDWPLDPYGPRPAYRPYDAPELPPARERDPYGPAPAWRPYDGPLWPDQAPWPEPPRPR